MKTSHLISDDLFTQAMSELSGSNHWITYNASQYLLDKGDMYFFPDKETALTFVINNTHNPEDFYTIKANSLMDIYDHFMIQASLQEPQHIYNQLKNTTMNDNIEYLEKQLKYTGFGEAHSEQLKGKVAEGEQQFMLQHEAKFGKENAIATLHFKKSDTSEMYFFNKYSLLLSNDQHPDPIKQTFYINNKQDNITLKEGLNLMSGRAVYKELSNRDGEKYNAWVQLNFKETDTNDNYKLKSFNDNYGFNLEAAVAKYNIKELTDPETKKSLLESLERGNRQAVTLSDGVKEVRIFIEASPQYKSLNMYDSHMNKVLPHELAEKTGVNQKQDGLKTGKADDEEAGSTKQKKSRGQSV